MHFCSVTMGRCSYACLTQKVLWCHMQSCWMTQSWGEWGEGARQLTGECWGKQGTEVSAPVLWRWDLCHHTGKGRNGGQWGACCSTPVLGNNMIRQTARWILHFCAGGPVNIRRLTSACTKIWAGNVNTEFPLILFIIYYKIAYFWDIFQTLTKPKITEKCFKQHSET